MELPPIAEVRDAYLMAGAVTLVDLPVTEREAPSYAKQPLSGIGVRTSAGEVAEHGTDIYRHRYCSPISPEQLSDPPERLTGTAIYAGVIGPQFGHVMSQSLGRLWVTEGRDPALPLLFINSNSGFTQAPAYLGVLLHSLGIANPLRLITRPARVESLILGPDLCNFERRPVATPAYLAWLRRNRPNVAVDPALRVYVSRSALDPRKAQYLQERALEDALREEGYSIIYPETLPMAAQIDIYQRASRLIFADGSTVHPWSLFSSAGQQAAIVLRRPLHRLTRDWFRSFDLARLDILDFVEAGFWGRGMGGQATVAVLDLAGLWERLGEGGFHSGKQTLGVPRDRLLDWLTAVEARADATATAPFPLDPVSRGLLALRPRMTRVEGR